MASDFSVTWQFISNITIGFSLWIKLRAIKVLFPAKFAMKGKTFRLQLFSPISAEWLIEEKSGILTVK
jgi:hypothetical protein